MIDASSVSVHLARAALARAWSEAERHGAPLAVAVADADGFKAWNDRYGHAAGDRALRRIARALRRGCRTSDFVARWGGDEFAVWLPETDAIVARRQAEAVVVAVRQLGCTVSVGVAEWNSTREGANELLLAADKALYEAKAAGRDRVA
jgi:diguanylate cyclase (GGDEF)-like protein